MRPKQLVGLVLMALGMWQASALANCPMGYPNEIFCDDFDTYCSESSGGHPGDSKCPTSGATRNDQRLSEVWLREPRVASGVEVIVADDQARLTSAPYGGHYPCQGDAQYSPNVIRDWVHSPYPLSDPGQIRNLSWKIEQVFGPNNTAVVGTDDQPLILEFMMDGGGSDKIDWANGYMSVSLDDGDEAGKIDTANTDYADSPDCNTYCNPYIQIEPMPIICAQGNPLGPLPAACPSVALNPPPIRHVISVGTLGMMDFEPCHCGSTTAHGPANNHLNVFDGQKWWMLRTNNPVATTGNITPRTSGAPAVTDPTAVGLSKPGNFDLNGGSTRSPNKSFNFVTLTLKTTTLDVQMTTLETSTTQVPGSNPAKYYQYYITSQVTLPRAYLGAFNALRMGVDEGCQILGTPSNAWACGGSNTHPLRSRAPQAGSLDFDDIYFHGGMAVTQIGACCHADATCENVLAEACVGSDHSFRGPNTTCETLVTQPCCPAIYGDSDADGDVDIVDFGKLQQCLTTGGGPISTECKCLNFNGDTAINSLDVEHFIACANGPGVAGNSADPCKGVNW